MNVSKCSRYLLTLTRHSNRVVSYSNINRLTIPTNQKKHNYLFQSRNVTAGTSNNESVNPETVSRSMPSAEGSPPAKESPGTHLESRVIALLQACGIEQCCKPLSARRKSLNDVWNEIIKNHGSSLSAAIYNVYLQVCMENEVEVNHTHFLETARHRVNRQTYLLLLENACQRGDVQSAVDLLAVMKANDVPADELVFNAMILGHIVNRGMEGGKFVLATMKLAQMPSTENTHWAIIKGLSKRKDEAEFTAALTETPRLRLDETQLLSVLLNLAVNDKHSWFQHLSEFLGVTSIPRNSLPRFENLCIDLIYRCKPEAAIEYYKALVEPTAEGGYASKLLKEMLLSKTPIENIISICKDLEQLNLNRRATLEVTEMALQNELVEECYKLFEHLGPLKPHYFWPLILSCGASAGEAGVLEVLRKMRESGVEADDETLSFYLLPLCDASDVDALFSRLKNVHEFKNRELVTPMVYNLLIGNRIDDAKLLCEKHDVPINGDKLMKQLCTSWLFTGNSSAAASILQKICETNSINDDWTGKFLLKCLKMCRKPEEYTEALELINILHSKQLRVSSLVADHIFDLLKYKARGCTIKEELEAAVDKLLDVSRQDSHHIQHPRDMALEELECHLVELKSKKMETRGVLRRLIQLHTRTNNVQRVAELRSDFKASDYEESPGMKASLLHTYTLACNLKLAEEIYADIKSCAPDFKIDLFKVVDYAKLLVENGKCVHAIDILKQEARSMSKTDLIMRNCRELLSAATTPEDTFNLFQTLVQTGYCKASNIMLGPVVRAHLNQGDLLRAVEVYCKCAADYRCTPLQLELMCKVIEGKDEELLKRVLDATSSVHGAYSTKMTLIAALAEQGMQKPLTKYLIEIRKVTNEEIEKRCKRWIAEDKLLPLTTILGAAHRLPSTTIDLSIIKLSILKIYSTRNDCEGALNFWMEMAESDEGVSSNFTVELRKLLERCNYEVPKSLLNVS